MVKLCYIIFKCQKQIGGEENYINSLYNIVYKNGQYED